MDKSKITKQNGNIAFEEEAHIYYDVTQPEEKFISVTTLIHSFTQPFDKEFWSAYKALEKLLPKEDWEIEKKSLLNTKKFDKILLESHNINENDFNREQQLILDNWDEENKKSCERGTKIHADLENSFYNRKNIDLSKYQIGGKFECIKDHNTLDLENGVYPEYLIHKVSKDGKLRIAGQIDLLVKRGNKIIIGDWKGLPLDTEIPTLSGWSTMENLKVGDTVFDKNGKKCKVVIKSEIHHNPCYKIHFSKDINIVADCDHRWLINFSTHPTNSKWKGSLRTEIMTTKELYDYLQTYNPNNQYQVPKIYINKELDLEEQLLPIDPYVLGLWLGDGTADNGRITQELGTTSWDIIKSKGFELGDNSEHRDKKAETKTVYGLRTLLKENNLLNNKYIPDIYQRSSKNQRINLIRGLMDADGFYDKIHKMFIMSTNYYWQADGMIKLLSSLGVKSTFNIVKRPGYNGVNPNKVTYDVKFKTSKFNPFMCRNQNVICEDYKFANYYSIKKIEPVDMVPTQCIQVDSPSHTFLCTRHMLVTHNTNKKIETKSFYDTKTRSNVMMKYPLNTLQDVNYWHYTLQLSTYAWMVQQLDPAYEIEDLVLVHFDHNDNMTVYHLPYLKEEVIKMLVFYKKKHTLEENKRKRQRIEY